MVKKYKESVINNIQKPRRAKESEQFKISVISGQKYKEPLINNIRQPRRAKESAQFNSEPSVV